MESKGRIISFRPNTIKDKTVVELELDTTDEVILQDIERMMKTDIRAIIKTWREGRSRTANNYFYVLVDKMADVLKVSKPFVHNMLLRKYGEIEQLDGKPIWVVLPENDEVAKKVDEDSFLHLRPTDQVKTGTDGKPYRTYLLLKGSHQLDTKHMSILLDGTVNDARELGIPTESPAMIRQMKERWGVDIAVDSTK